MMIYTSKMGIRVFMFRIVSRMQFEHIIFMIRMQNERVAKALHIGSLYPGVVVPVDDVIIREHPDLVPNPRYMQPSIEYWACEDYFLTYDDIFANARQIYITFTTSSTCEEYYYTFESEFGRDFFGEKKPRWYGGCGDHCRSMTIHREEGDDELETLPTYVELTQWAADSFENPTYVQPPTPIEPREVRLRREDDVVLKRHSKASMIANEGKRKKAAAAQAERQAHAIAPPASEPAPPIIAAAAAPPQRIRTTLHNRTSHSHYAVHSKIAPPPSDTVPSMVVTPPTAAAQMIPPLPVGRPPQAPPQESLTSQPASAQAPTARRPRRKRTPHVARTVPITTPQSAPAPAPSATSQPPSGV